MNKLPILAAVFVVVWLSPRQASAQSEPAAPSPLKVPSIVWAGAVAADWATTYRFSTRYDGVLHERNPLIGGLDGHPAWMVAAGASIDAATWWVANRYIGRRHPRLMTLALYGAAAYRVYLAAYNVRMMQEAQGLIDAPRSRSEYRARP